MKHFRFRLERVRRVRSIEVDVARGHLQSAQVRLTEAEARRESLRSSIQGLRRLWKSRLEGAFAPEELLTLEAEIERQLETETRAARRVTTLAADVERARQQWAARRTAERALELLEGRQRTEHDLENRREETKETDETASRRARNRFQREGKPGR